MRILVVGSGGREHALAWKLASDGHDVLSAPGNPGMAELGRVLPVPADDLQGLANLALEERIDLTVVGPEAPLVAGIADCFNERGLALFGPSRAAAAIEGSKSFCREMARRAGAPMAEGESFDDPDAALDYARALGTPLIVKADGLAAGKGVTVCGTWEEAERALSQAMRERVFGAAGERVVIEEFLEGRETSLFCITDGRTRIVLAPAQDYKRVFDGDRGPNTGGMGSYSPVPWLAPEMRERAVREIVEPVLDALDAAGRPYRGCFYAGLMITEKGPRLVEVNCRFGDPETQALLPRLASDLGSLLMACARGGLSEERVEWRREASVCVVAASAGYPGPYETGKKIRGLDSAEELALVFHAGTVRRDGELYSAGGRVLNVCAVGPELAEARARAYDALARIEMDGMHYRTDIAQEVE